MDLIDGLQGLYEAELRRGEPAYEPSWMWAELGLEEGAWPKHPPPLAPERVGELVPGSTELTRTVAEQLRASAPPSWVLDDDSFRANLDLQRFVRERAAGVPGGALARLLHLLVNFELHRRKSFWIDEALAWTLDSTDLEVVGRELRAPFPSFALVFTDRHVLSLAERAVARTDRACPVVGPCCTP